MAAAPQPASTLILIRDGVVSPEVLMLERHAKSEFLPDMYVFPGGRVEAADRDLADRTGGISAAEAKAALPMVAAELSQAFFVAAIRETFEESGILLARRRGQADLISGEHAASLLKHRLEIQGGKRSFRLLLESEDLELAGDLLCVHAHWVTPEAVPRRFDTLFFSAVAPEGQIAQHDGFESTDHVWIRPEEALEQAKMNERRIIFPTTCNLQVLCGFATASEVLNASRNRPVVTVLPRVVESDGARKLVIPPEAGYPTHEELIGREPR